MVKVADGQGKRKQETKSRLRTRRGRETNDQSPEGKTKLSIRSRQESLSGSSRQAKNYRPGDKLLSSIFMNDFEHLMTSTLKVIWIKKAFKSFPVE